MKRVIVIFSLVFVSMFGFSACEGESEFDEIHVDEIEDTHRPSAEGEDDGDGPG